MINYPTCIMQSISKKFKENYNCSLPFLNETDDLENCNNTKALQAIKEIKKALEQQEFGKCLDLKPCNHVQFTINDYHFSHSPYNPITNIQFSFKGFLVEYVEDSYLYNFITIFSEIGGSLGILVGLSCMTIVDFFIDAYKKIQKV